MKTSIHTLLSLTFLIMTSVASAADQTSTTSEPGNAGDSNRLTHRLGAYVGILGDPHPTLLGFNVAYNVTDYLRASAGVGKVSAATSISVTNSGTTTNDQSMTTIGVAAKFLVPDWNLTPSATLGFSHISLSDGLSISDYKSTNLYVGLGGDWQADSGFNMGAGLNISMNGGAPTAPYINVGMFF